MKRSIIGLGCAVAAGLIGNPRAEAAALVGYWGFNADSAADASGNANNGTLTGGPTFSTDVPAAVGSGKSISFDGVDDFVSVAHSASLALSSQMTVSFWMKGDSTDTDQWIRPIGKDNNAGTAAGWELQRNSATTEVRIRIDTDATNNQEKSGTGMTTAYNGSWHHLAFAFNAGSLSIFVDGVKSTATYTPGTTGFGNTAPLLFGKSGQETGREYRGLLDDVAIWDVPLPDGSITGLANGTYTPLTAPVPEPASAAAVGGIVAVGLLGRRRARR